MSKSAKTAEHEEADENVLLDEGFSVVDDINAGLGSSEKSLKKTNDDKKEDVSSSKKEDIVDKKNKQTETKKDKTATKENSEPIKTCSDGSTLILSNDVDLGTETPLPQSIKVKVEKGTEDPQNTVTDKNSTRNEKREEKNGHTPRKTPIRKKGTSSNYVWITNVSNSVNASSLKKHFSDCGKVNTAKVVTNGKLFFGYVEFDTPKIAQECVEKMNCTVLGGRKILVSRSRPDVTKKTPRKSLKNDQQIVKCKEGVEKKTEVEKDADLRKITSDKKETEKSNDKMKNEEKKKSEDEKKKNEDEKKKNDEEKKTTEDKNKVAEIDKRKRTDPEKRPRGSKEVSTKGDDLRLRMNETKKKLDTLRTDLERTRVEVQNLRRRLTNETKKYKAEELRAERYRQQLRKLEDEMKEAKLEFRRDVHRLNKKHKMELEKAEFDRESFLKKENDLRRRQEDLNREFKKLEEAKKSLEHLKRSRKSRSPSPSVKRFRGREAAYPEMSPPPAPKLSGDALKPLLDRPPSSYYEEKKSRGVYERLGEYTDKSYSKDSSNGRYRRTYPGESMAVPKSSWSSLPSESWKKNLPPASANFMKPYLERFGGEGYGAQPSSYYPPGTSEYPKHFESSRKY